MDEQATNVVSESCCEARTSRDPANEKPRDIIIKSLNLGYLVQVGCQTFAIEERNKLLINLEAYLTNPQETEKEWMSSKKLK